MHGTNFPRPMRQLTQLIKETANDCNGRQTSQVYDYLGRVEEELRTKDVNGTQGREILAELNSHLIDRIAEFQSEGSPNPVGQAPTASGDRIEIASELGVSADLRATSHSFFPTSLPSAEWSLARKFGRGPGLFLSNFSAKPCRLVP